MLVTLSSEPACKLNKMPARSLFGNRNYVAYRQVYHDQLAELAEKKVISLVLTAEPHIHFSYIPVGPGIIRNKSQTLTL